MKKIIGTLSVAVISATMYFNTSKVSDSTTDLSLASLMSMNTSHAESGGSSVTCYNAFTNGNTFSVYICSENCVTKLVGYFINSGQCIAK